VRLPLAFVGHGAGGCAQQGDGQDDGFEQDIPQVNNSNPGV
jgi:hypothetical protein